MSTTWLTQEAYDRLTAELKWEPPAGPHARGDQLFPHLYGPLNPEAVVTVTYREVGPADAK